VLAVAAPAPLIWLAVQAMRHPAGTHTVRILAQAAGTLLTAAGLAGLLDLATTGAGGLLGRLTGGLDVVLSVWGAAPVLLGLVAAGLTAATGITPVAVVTTIATARRRPALPADEDLDGPDDIDQDDALDAPPAPHPPATAAAGPARRLIPRNPRPARRCRAASPPWPPRPRRRPPRRR